MTDQVKINRGLKGVYFERSGVSHIDGAKGSLAIGDIQSTILPPIPHLKRWPIC